MNKRQVRCQMVRGADPWVVDLADDERIIAADHEGAVAWVYIEGPRRATTADAHALEDEGEKRDSIVVRLSWPVPDNANPEAWSTDEVARRLLHGVLGIEHHYGYMGLRVERLA